MIKTIVFTILLSLLGTTAFAKLSNQEAATQRDLAETYWLAQDGLMLLNPNEDREPFPGQEKRTAGNDNGILFTTELYWLFEENGVLSLADSLAFEKTVRALQVNGYTGVYNRNPGRTDRGEAHDNYVAIVSGSVLFNLPFPQEIVRFGETRGFFYNNLNPEDTGINKAAFWRPGNEIAFYKMCAGIQPSGGDYIWLWLATFTSGFASADNSSGHLLDWLRIKALDRADEKYKNVPWHWMYTAMIPAKEFWKWRLLKKTNGKGMEHFFDVYFGGRKPPNPMVKLSEGITY